MFLNGTSTYSWVLNQEIGKDRALFQEQRGQGGAYLGQGVAGGHVVAPGPWRRGDARAQQRRAQLQRAAHAPQVALHRATERPRPQVGDAA